jgi:hypothetical protein
VITLEVCAGSALAGPEMRTGRAAGEKDQCGNPVRERTTQNLGPPRADRPAWLSISGPNLLHKLPIATDLAVISARDPRVRGLTDVSHWLEAAGLGRLRAGEVSE